MIAPTENIMSSIEPSCLTTSSNSVVTVGVRHAGTLAAYHPLRIARIGSRPSPAGCQSALRPSRFTRTAEERVLFANRIRADVSGRGRFDRRTRLAFVSVLIDRTDRVFVLLAKLDLFIAVGRRINQIGEALKRTVAGGAIDPVSL